MRPFVTGYVIGPSSMAAYLRHIPRRSYEETEEPARGRVRDRDSAAAARNLKAFVWSGAAGVMGVAAGLLRWGLPGGVIGGVIGWAVAFYVARGMTAGAGAAMSQIYNPSGASTPWAREYSEPQALARRGLYQEAIDCYESYVCEFPDDPQPCVGIARLYRDRLERYEDAARWFRRARLAKDIDRRGEVLVTRELIELYTGKLDQPGRAMPELARLAERFAGSREGDSAREELARLRAMLGGIGSDPA